MNLFELHPFPKLIPQLGVRDALLYLYKKGDIQGTDSQFENFDAWKDQLTKHALQIVQGALQYCHSINDREGAEKISRISWSKRWSDSNKGDIASDLNFIYWIISGDNSSTNDDNSDRINFLVSLSEQTSLNEKLFHFPKEIVPTQTVPEESSLEELNKALMAAFITDSKGGQYSEENLAKLRK